MDPESDSFRYPLAHAGGYRGTKTEMRKGVNADIRRELQLRSRKPPRLRWYRPHHQGHPVTSPILCTAKPEKAGSWIQLCKGDHVQVGCARPFVLVPPLGEDHAQEAPFAQLYAIRKELAQIPRGSAQHSGPQRHEQLSTPPSSPVMIDLTLSPTVGPISSPPSSPLLGVLTLAGANDHKSRVKVSARFWVNNAAAPPIRVDLETEAGTLYLEKHKEPLGRLGVEKTPMDFFNKRRGRWEAFTWAEGVDLRGKKEVAIKERGLQVVIDV
ncbi:hypothetical protein V5O48_013792 [Marasmius crinis-equi]|uniref:Uncharacterized protein n=1 Tax=Marasmius crinis-equi TaxID=585013 RepID=A0ABR3EZ39_9AGAR